MQELIKDNQAIPFNPFLSLPSLQNIQFKHVNEH